MKKRGMRKPEEKHIFVRLGPANGQYQRHRNGRAPAKRGIWMLPIQFAMELAYLGGWSGRLANNKEEQAILNKLLKMPQEEVAKTFKLDIKHYRSKNFWLESIYDPEWVLENQFANKKFKRHYRKIYLKMTDVIWCHLPPKGMHMFDEDENWHECSVREFWYRAKKYLTGNWGEELYEVFLEV